MSCNYRIDSVLNHTDQVVLSGSENGLVYAWDLLDTKLLAKLDHKEASNEGPAIPGLGRLTGNNLTVHSLTFHPKECRLITAARGKVFFWADKPDQE